MIIEKSITDVSSKHPKATNPRISSICERLSPTSLAVGRIGVGELDGVSLLMVVGAFCEGSTVCPLTVITLGAISQMVVICEDGSTCGGAVGGGVGISPTNN